MDTPFSPSKKRSTQVAQSGGNPLVTPDEQHSMLSSGKGGARGLDKGVQEQKLQSTGSGGLDALIDDEASKGLDDKQHTGQSLSQGYPKSGL